MRTLYFDCFSGIAGDMTIAALLDLGLALDDLKTELAKLPLDGYELRATRVVRANLSAMKFDVLIDGSIQDEPGHGHSHEPRHSYHGGDVPHTDEQNRGIRHGHRKASEILAMVSSSGLKPGAKKMATDIFTKLAVSEGKVHHVSPADVEFHEVGMVDSIVDTVGAAIGFDLLGVERFRCSPINVGGGFIHCQHGIYPSPAPASADLLRQATIYSKHVDSELVTPTGAAILAAVVKDFSPLSGFSTDRIGYGAGTKQFQNFPNCVRLFLGEERGSGGLAEVGVSPAEHFDEIEVIETNIDDMTPQNLAFVMDRLFELGALDVAATPVLMKKGRPGQMLQVQAPPNRVAVLCEAIFKETTTIGLRRTTARRTVLERKTVRVPTEFGEIPVKVSRFDGRETNVAPEFEDCARIARERNVPLKDVQAAALRAYVEVRPSKA